MKNKISEWWLRTTELDGRSLQLARVLLGLAMLYQQARDFLFADIFFSGSGVAPAALVHTVRNWGDFLSIHRLSDDVSVQRILFALGVATALALIFGFKTRFTLILAWYLTASAHARNPLLLQIGDTQLRMMLFFMMFLPWNQIQKGTVRSWANGFLLLQVALSFWFAAAQKTGIDWQHGTAVFYTLHSGSFATAWADALLGSPRKVLLFLTWLSPYIEALIPILFFAGRWARVMAVTLMIAAAIGLGLLFDLETYALISIAAALLLLPGACWKGLSEKLGQQKQTDVAAPFSTRWTGASTAALVFWILSLWANLAVVLTDFQDLNVRPLRALIGGVGFAQKWVLFQNVNRKDFGYYRVVAARSAQGESAPVWSFFENKSVALDALPERGAEIYPSMEWRRFTTALLREVRGPIGFIGPGLCRAMGAQAGSRVQLWQYYRRLKFGLPADFYQRRLLLDFSCAEGQVLYDLRVETPEDAGPFPQDGAT